jgi:GDPmannose 4,6-dehydratase
VPTAFITGITGQDGRYLAEHLIENGYEVHGLIRGQQNPKRIEIERTLPGVTLHAGDLLDDAALRMAIQRSRPDEVYNLAAVSFVQFSFANPFLTGQVTGMGALRVLEIIRTEVPAARFYQASTSEMFGLVRETPQNESTPFHPRSPYAVAKTYAHHTTVNYREAYGLFAVSGILFNHESPRRGTEFVTRKVTRAAAAIKLGRESRLELGNLDSRRDWGFAGDYVRAMHAMLRQAEPSDFVVGTGETHSVRELCATAFGALDLPWERHVVVSEAHVRPSEVPDLRADATRARELLQWRPTVSFEQMIEEMVRHDYDELRKT